MNLLFDIISLQWFHNGGEEYVRKVLYKLLESPVRIVGVYDSHLKFLDDDWEILNGKIKLYDIREYSISRIIEIEGINKFYIGIGQRYLNYNLENILCDTIVTIHDIFDIELFTNRIYRFLRPDTTEKIIKDLIKKLIGLKRNNPKDNYTSLIRLILQKNTSLVTVSDYTKFSLLYFFPELKNKNIDVLYSPPKILKLNEKNHLDNEFLDHSKFIDAKYILFVSSDRDFKNAAILKKIFPTLKKFMPDLKLIFTSANENSSKGDILYLKYVSTSDLELLYKNAWALIFASFLEGFGYPPIEAMKYGTPVVCSNVTSMPELLGNNVLYFSPFYPSDLFNKILYLQKNYTIYKDLSQKGFERIHHKQEADFQKLISLILA